MKKNDWILLTSAAAYSFLFYEENPGANFLIFTTLLILLLIIRNNRVIKKSKWIVAAVGCMLSAFCVFYYGNSLSVIANIISLMLLSALSCSTNTSVITSLCFSLYSISASFVFMILDWIERTQKKTLSLAKRSGFLKFMIYVFPVLMVLLFFFLYKGSNPIFDNLTQNINFNFISVAWIFFSIGGVLLLYGFYYHKTIPFLATIDNSASNSLSELKSNEDNWISRNLSIENEVTSGIILLSLLNILLLIVNGLDLNYLWFNGKLPSGLSYSSFVHQGTALLITSIVVAVLIIMFYFRGRVNLYKKNKVIKLLAFCWIIQNAFMIISTSLRNGLYIHEYSLTYKRIGVYVWLLLAFIGLSVTFIKIAKAKTNWYLFRTNGWMFFGVLVLSCFFNWDGLVTDFNIERAINSKKAIDKFYLLSLTDKNIPQLLMLNDSIKNENTEEMEFLSRKDYSEKGDGINFKEELNAKLYSFMNKMNSRGWKSFNISDQSVYKQILQLNADHKIDSLTLNGKQYHSLVPIIKLNSIKSFKLVHSDFKELNKLNYFKELETLTLSDNNITEIYLLPALPALKELDISSNKVENISPLERFSNLESLDISGNDKIRSFSSLIRLKKLRYLKIGIITREGLSSLQHTLSGVKIDATVI